MPVLRRALGRLLPIVAAVAAARALERARTRAAGQLKGRLGQVYRSSDVRQGADEVGRPRLGNRIITVAAVVTILVGIATGAGMARKFVPTGRAYAHDVADYRRQIVPVCDLVNANRRIWHAQLEQFSEGFRRASALADAVDSVRLVAEQEIEDRSGPWEALASLKPPPSLRHDQIRLERIWSANLAVLRKYKADLESSVSSDARLVTIIEALPRAAYELNSSIGRSLLRRLGGERCGVVDTVDAPPVTWPTTLRRGIAVYAATSCSS